MRQHRDIDYTEELRHLVGDDYPDKQAISITLQVTEACTLACKYCYQHEKTPARMSWETCKKAIDRIFIDYKDTHFAVVLDFIGGEPFLEPELIDKATDYWFYKCIKHRKEVPWYLYSRFSICSNGTEWDDPRVQKLMNKIGTTTSFTVSIDGNKELHDSARVHLDGVTGSYDEAIHAAEDATKKFGYKMGSKMTIAPSNIIFLYPALKHYLDSGENIIHANCVYEEGWTVEHAKLFYNELKRLADYKLEHYPDTYLSLFDETQFCPANPDDDQPYCGGRGKMLAIAPDGTFYPCLRYTPTSVGHDRDYYITCGNVNDGLDNTMIDELAKCTRSVIEDEECYNCPIHQGCGECAAYSWEVTNRSDKKVKFICIMHKARALANVYYWNKYFRQTGSNERFFNWVPEDWALEIIDRDELAMLYELSGQNLEEES